MRYHDTVVADADIDILAYDKEQEQCSRMHSHSYFNAATLLLPHLVFHPLAAVVTRSFNPNGGISL
jgi:hypothetical protein